MNFVTDAWTSPNHKAYMAFTVHFAHEGEPISMLLDLVEVVKSHSGENLATLCETRTMVIYNGKCVKLKITTYKVVFQTVEINNIFSRRKFQ